MPRPGGHNNPDAKAKDFGKAVTRLLKELKTYKLLIIISIVLATTSSILAIFTPNILSDLTDRISEGLIPNKDNIITIKESLEEDLNKDNLKTKLPSILNLNLNESTISEILSSDSVLSSDKDLFNKFLNDKDNFLTNLSTLPDSILNIIITDSTYNNQLISKKDKITLIKSLNETPVIPTSIARLLSAVFISPIMYKFSGISNNSLLYSSCIGIPRLSDSINMNNSPKILLRFPLFISSIIKK